MVLRAFVTALEWAHSSLARSRCSLQGPPSSLPRDISFQFPRPPSLPSCDRHDGEFSLSLLSHFSFCNISFFLDGSSLPRSVFPSAANEVRPRLHHSRRGCNEAIYWRERERSWSQAQEEVRFCGRSPTVAIPRLSSFKVTHAGIFKLKGLPAAALFVTVRRIMPFRQAPYSPLRRHGMQP